MTDVEHRPITLRAPTSASWLPYMLQLPNNEPRCPAGHSAVLVATACAPDRMARPIYRCVKHCGWQTSYTDPLLEQLLESMSKPVT